MEDQFSRNLQIITVESPIFYRAINKENFQRSLHKIDQQLNSAPIGDNVNFQPKIDEVVCVKITDKNTLKTSLRRGQIDEIDIKKNIFSIYLIDLGNYIEISREFIFPLSKEFKRISPLSYDILIDNIEPISSRVIDKKKNCFIEGNKFWQISAFAFIKEIFKKYTIKIKIYSQFENLIKGDLMVENRQGSYLISDLLHSYKYAYKKYSNGDPQITVDKTEITDHFDCIHTKETKMKTSENFENQHKQRRLFMQQLCQSIKQESPSTSSVISMNRSESNEPLDFSKNLISEDDFFQTPSFKNKDQTVGIKTFSNKSLQVNIKNIENFTIHLVSSVHIHPGTSNNISQNKNLNYFEFVYNGDEEKIVTDHDDNQINIEDKKPINEGINPKDPFENQFQKVDSIRDIQQTLVSSQKENSPLLNINNTYEKNPQQVINIKNKSNEQPFKEEQKILEENIDISSLKKENDQKPLHKFITKNQGWITRVCTPNVYISSCENFEPFDKIESLPYSPSYINCIERLGIKKLTNHETWTLSCIIKEHNILSIGPKKSGKTLSYLIPLLARINNETFSELPPGNSPHMIILVPSWKSGQEIFDICDHLIHSFELKILQIYGGGKEQEKYVDLLNGCDILITTPPCFRRLYTTSKMIINAKRLVALVLEETDKLIDRFNNDLENIIDECKHVSKKRQQIPLQFIVNGEIWNYELELLFDNFSCKRTVIISSPLEAAIFAGISTLIHLVSKENKLNELFKLIESTIFKKNVLIVFHDFSELEEIIPSIRSKFPTILLAHEKVCSTDLEEIFEQWTQNSQPSILISTDKVLPLICIRDVECLIHFSLPPLSKTQFSHRFSTFLDHLSPHPQSSQELNNHLFIDESINRQLPELILLTRRMGIDIPELETRVFEAQRTHQFEKNGGLLCSDYKAFGQCWNERTCSYRHNIQTDLDKPGEGIPLTGSVTLQLLTVEENCCFTARILKYEAPDGSMVDNVTSLNFVNFSMKLSLYCNGVLKRTKPPAVGDVWAIKNKFDCPTRVKILNIQENDVMGYFIDEGCVKNVDQRILIPISEELAQFPAQAVQIFLCNLLPCDIDQSWNPRISTELNKWLKITRESDYELFGKINLALGHTLWLDPLEVRRYLPNTKTYCVDLVIRNELLSKNLAVNNSHHLEKLRRLSLEAGLAIADIKPPLVKKKQIRDHAQWAHLPSNEWVEVHLIYVRDPHLFFIRQVKFIDSVEKLNKEIQNYLKNSFKHPKILENGGFVAVRENEESPWERAKIISVLEDDKAEVLTVDTGDHFVVQRKNIALLPNKLLDQLPCQTIEASLIGIEPSIPGNWPDGASSTFYKFGGTDDEFYTLHAKICEKKSSAQLTGGRHYRIVLFEMQNTISLCINARLVALGLASLIHPEAHFIENIEFEKPLQKNFSDIDSDSESNSNQMIISINENKSPKNLEEKFEIINYVEEEEEEERENENTFEFCINDPVEFLRNALKNKNEDDMALKLLELVKLKPLNDTQEKGLEENLINEEEEKEEEEEEYFISEKNIFKENQSIVTENNLNGNNQLSEEKMNISLKSEETEEYYHTNLNNSETYKVDFGEISNDQYNIRKEFLNNLQKNEVDYLNEVPGYIRITKNALTTWEQDEQFIYLKVHITGVEKYYLSCHLQFVQLITQDPQNIKKLISINLDLFGPVTLYKHDLSGFYISIKLIKITFGHMWPSLLRDGQKPVWLKLGTDLYERQSYIKQHFEEINMVNHLEPPHEDYYLENIKRIEDDHEPLKAESDSDSEDEEYLFKNLLTHYDPHDPFGKIL